MPIPGPEKGFDYDNTPYLVGWQPIAERLWAAKYVNEDGTEDFFGFTQEFTKRHPFLRNSGGGMAFLPKSASDYLRRDPMGARQDVDNELAAAEKPEEIVAEEKARKLAKTKDRWKAVQAAREKIEPEETLAEPKKRGRPKKTGTIADAQAETIAQHMG